MAEVFELRPCRKCGDKRRYLSNFRCVTCQRHQSLIRGNAKNAEKQAATLTEVQSRAKMLEIELQKYRHQFGEI